jgi:oligosaccharide translocation protein RFT1
LGWYCLYILLMGINGITEAFAHASADSKQLKRLNYIMIAQSAVFIGAAIVLISALETVGMIFASCISMTIRIATSVWWINTYCRQRGIPSISLRDALPHRLVTMILVVSFVATYLSSNFFCSYTSCAENYGFSMQKQLMHIGVGGAFGVASLASCYLFERDLLMALIGRRRS